MTREPDHKRNDWGRVDKKKNLKMCDKIKNELSINESLCKNLGSKCE